MSSRSLSLLLYNSLLPLGLLFMAPAALLKMHRRGGRWQDFAQRLGFIGARKQAMLAGLERSHRLWMHAVSVGEVGVARRLITALLKADAQCSVVLTTTTPTGYKLACEMEAAFAGRVMVLYSPLDLPFIARRMLRLLKPVQLVLIEAEVWPNIVATAQDNGVRVSLVNARLSARSEARYHKALPLVQPIFAMLDRVLVQEPGDVDRWAGIGARRAHIQCIGSLKYDPQGADADPALVAALRDVLGQAGIAPTRPILLLASTHAGEELALGKVYASLRLRVPGLALLVVPRHFERGAEVLADLSGIGLRSGRRSDLRPGGNPNPSEGDVLVIDTTGELCAWQSLATVVVIGKSFLAEGGQNPAEAVMAGKPVVFGPHMENFEPLVGLLLGCEGAVQVGCLEELAAALMPLLSDSEARNRIALAGGTALRKHQGAIERAVQALLA
jgi:3-deoxy-D-manno-octulosonic-acid transferase